MLTVQRKQWILDRLAREGQVVARELSHALSTSEDTIRRDLRELAAEGRLQRVHGGALPVSAALGNLARRREVAPDDKLALARAAIALIRPGQVIVLDGGTTTTQLARQLPLDLPLTVVTHSPGVAVELEGHTAVDVILLGGRLFRHSMVCMGAATIEAAQRIRADLYFMGVTGAHPKAGMTTGDHEESAIKRSLHESAAETVVMASREKLGAASPFTIVPASSIATLVVPHDTAASVRKPFGRLGIDVVVAPPITVQG